MFDKFTSDFIAAETLETRSSKGWAFPVFRRLSDLFIALALLPGLLFCMVILFCVNWFFNPGTMFFKQERVGLNGKIFNIYKFRTMRVEVANFDPKFAVDEQDRIGRLGAFMRGSRIDEVPQILNVLKGEMSVVGPRPEQVFFYEAFERSIPDYAKRQSVRPGITGLAQLKYGYTNDEAGTIRKLKWDMEYIHRQGFQIEIHIMWQTFLFVMGRLLHLPMKSKL